MKKLIAILILLTASLTFYGQTLNWQKMSVENTIEAEAGKGYLLLTNRQAATVILPANPIAGDMIGFLDVGGTFPFNNLTIDPGEIPIKGNLGTHSYTQPNLSLTLVYTASPYGWKPLHTSQIDMNNAFQFPTIDGTANQLLQTDGSGTLTWVTFSGGASKLNDLSDAYYDVASEGNLFLGTIPLSISPSYGDGENNVMIGYLAGEKMDSDYKNIGIGSYALSKSNYSYANVAIGHESMFTTEDCEGNVAIGYKTLYENTSGDDNVAIGYNVLNLNTTGYENVGVGPWALSSNTSGYGNVALGYDALGSTVSKNGLIAIGYQAHSSGVNSTENTVIGYNAMRTTNNSDKNIALGYQSLENLGEYSNGNIAIGYQAGQNSDDYVDHNIAIGSEAGKVFRGSGNIAMGNKTLIANTGSYNVSVGYMSGYANISGSGNVFLGKAAGQSETGSNKLYIDNSGVTTPLIYGDFATKKLTIHNVLILNPIASAPISPVEGEIYSNSTDHHLYFYNGSAWVQLDN